MPSKVIRSFRYEPTKAELHVEFQSGRRYVYQDVPEEMYHAMKAAFSKGAFFNTNIRDRFVFTEAVK
jgi:KTSC domain